MLVDEELGVLRYGGSMVNAPEYRWKKMIGDRDRRPQYKGWWYPYSTNGFGIEDFVQFCRAAGFESVFAINDEETPEDAADLVEYLNGPATSEWGKRRAANGHPDPYGVRYIEIGNEEKTDAHYIERFQAPRRRHARARPERAAHHRGVVGAGQPGEQADRPASWTARRRCGTFTSAATTCAKARTWTVCSRAWRSWCGNGRPARS